MKLLQISNSNKKFKKLDATRRVYSISLLAGHNCPFAKDCRSSAVMTDDGKLSVKDGPNTVFRCFSASQEAQYRQTYQARFMNGALIKKAHRLAGIDGVTDLLEDSLLNHPRHKIRRADMDSALIRPHISGDMFSLWYLDAWLALARRRPQWRIYFYTKALPLLVFRIPGLAPLWESTALPDNVHPIASRGGTHDHLIPGLLATGRVRESRVVYSVEEAERLGLEIDIDDSLAAFGDKSFALLIHSTQPKGSRAASAVQALRVSS